MPLWEMRSESARRMASSFSGVRARLLGFGVKVLPQPWQRHLAVPERLAPNPMSWLLPQWGQEIATIPALYKQRG